MVDRRETGLELREDFREDLSQGQEEETGWLPRTSDSQCGFVVPGDQTHPCSPLSLPAAVLWREAISLFQACNTGKSLFPPGSESPRDKTQLQDGATECSRHYYNNIALYPASDG